MLLADAPHSLTWTAPTTPGTVAWMHPRADEGPAVARDLVGTQRLVPLVEEVPERVDPVRGRLDVDDPVVRVRVKPVVTALRAVERTRRGLLRDRPDQPDRPRQRARVAVHEHLEMGV